MRVQAGYLKEFKAIFNYVSFPVVVQDTLTLKFWDEQPWNCSCPHAIGYVFLQCWTFASCKDLSISPYRMNNLELAEGYPGIQLSWNHSSWKKTFKNIKSNCQPDNLWSLTTKSCPLVPQGSLTLEPCAYIYTLLWWPKHTWTVTTTWVRGREGGTAGWVRCGCSCLEAATQVCSDVTFWLAPSVFFSREWGTSEW